MSETPKPEQKTASILRAASVIMTGLPELPGYNGAVLIIDDDEASRISMEISEASEAFELLERELAEKTDAVQDAADMIDDWRNRARREKDLAISLEENNNAVKRELADAEEAVLSLNAQLTEANKREEKLKTMLLDPTTVHINMMRGIIAKLDWPTLEHIHGNHPLRAQRDALLEALERCDPGPEWELEDDMPGASVFCELTVSDMRAIRTAIALAKGGGQ